MQLQLQHLIVTAIFPNESPLLFITYFPCCCYLDDGGRVEDESSSAVLMKRRMKTIRREATKREQFRVELRGGLAGI